MSLWYRLLYQVGLTPWEEDPPHELVAEQSSALFDREEREHAGASRRALDLGCGSGIWSVRLAARGWQVTGVDVVPRAIDRARERARVAGVEVRFIPGDVTRLGTIGIGRGFRFVLDFECFNHLNDVQRSAVGREVSAVATEEATLLMLVWAPGRRWPLPPGASREDIERAFPQWTIVDEEGYAATAALPSWMKSVDPRFYRLQRG